MAAHSSGAGSPVSSDQEAEEEYHSATEDQSRVSEKCPDPDSNSEVERGVAGLCVSEAEEEASDEVGGAKERVELSEEQIKEFRENAIAAKTKGNELFKNGDYSSAIECYTEALSQYSKSCDLEDKSCDHERAVCFANRAACNMKKEAHQDVIDDCTEALALEPNYLKSLLRRAQAYEALEKYDDALEDYKKVLELDSNQISARQAVVYLPDKIKEQHEKLKTEMFGKLKELGNAILNPFGLSTENFQMQQDPNTGGYSVNFKR